MGDIHVSQSVHIVTTGAGRGGSGMVPYDDGGGLSELVAESVEVVGHVTLVAVKVAARLLIATVGVTLLATDYFINKLQLLSPTLRAAGRSALMLAEGGSRHD